MTKILLDINILQDVLSARKGWLSSIEILNILKQRKARGYISALNIPTLWYLNSKIQNIKKQIKILTSVTQIIPLSKDILNKSFNDKKFKDFEDAIQYFSARKKQCKIIITRNKKDFPVKNIKILTPKEFLKLLDD
ncbi:hypothetical protein CL633_00785 [bacterium]|nr:hypothetical protein [bacterium]|tara:strand:+ start:359 stop:766 length:408 start_codon:yes stop_codon:yes gene_type:complete